MPAKAASTVASGLMSRYAVTVRPEESIAAAARLVHWHAVQRLPVVDAAGRLLGIVSRGDLLKVLLRSDDEIQRDVLADLTATGVTADLARSRSMAASSLTREIWLTGLDCVKSKRSPAPSTLSWT